MKTVKKAGIVFLALLLALLLLSPLATIHLGPRELTVGLVGVAYASETPDYTADGSADNVQFQDAIAALPATGGIIRILPGTYTFSATVTKAVANVTIQGAGKNTKINYNA